MSNIHELGNMIFNLENKKNLKEVNFTKDAVREVLGYLKELYEIKNKEHEEDRRVVDLEIKLRDVEQEQIKEMQEHQEAMELADKTITNLVEDNRASQEWYKKQLAESEKDRVMWQEMYKSADKQNKEICETDIYPLQEENQKLKQQLAEKESEADQRYKDWQEEIRECDGLRVVLSEVRKQLADTETQNKRVLEKLELIVSANQELEQKLAEKDKEIISLECVISEIHNDIKEMEEFKVGEDGYDLTDSDARFSLECELLNKDQDKISFALEQLEICVGKIGILKNLKEMK